VCVCCVWYAISVWCVCVCVCYKRVWCVSVCVWYVSVCVWYMCLVYVVFEGDNGVAQLWSGPNATECRGGSVGKCWPYKHRDLSLIFRTQVKASFLISVHCNLGGRDRGRDRQIPGTPWPSKTHLTHRHTPHTPIRHTHQTHPSDNIH